jgi:ABC-type amino acid transport substrate-binding protein
VVASLLVPLVAAAALVAPAGGARGRSNTLPTRVPGTLTVAVDLGTIGLAEGSVVNEAITHANGFEIDLAKTLAKRLGLRLKLVDVPFAQTFTAGAKPFDVAVSHATITAARARSVDFSAPYFIVNKGVLVAPGVTPPRRPRAVEEAADLRPVEDDEPELRAHETQADAGSAKLPVTDRRVAGTLRRLLPGDGRRSRDPGRSEA